jgi:hypothetical protein
VRYKSYRAIDTSHRPKEGDPCIELDDALADAAEQEAQVVKRATIDGPASRARVMPDRLTPATALSRGAFPRVTL